MCGSPSRAGIVSEPVRVMRRARVDVDAIASAAAGESRACCEPRTPKVHAATRWLAGSARPQLVGGAVRGRSTSWRESVPAAVSRRA